MSTKVTQALTGNLTMGTQTTGSVLEFTSTLKMPPTVTIPILAVGSSFEIINLSASAIFIAPGLMPIEVPSRCAMLIEADGTDWFPAGAASPLQGQAPTVLPQLRGVNLAGGTLTWQSLPPVSGTNYLFPSTQDVDYIVSKGANFVRLLFSWEAIQSTLNGTLGVGGAAYATYLSQFQ